MVFVVCTVVSRTRVVPLDMARAHREHRITALIHLGNRMSRHICDKGDLNSWSTVEGEERRRGQVTQESETDEDRAYHVDSGSSG